MTHEVEAYTASVEALIRDLMAESDRNYLLYRTTLKELRALRDKYNVLLSHQPGMKMRND